MVSILSPQFLSVVNHLIGLGCGKTFVWDGVPANLPEGVEPRLDVKAWKRGEKRVLLFHVGHGDGGNGMEAYTCGRVTPL